MAVPKTADGKPIYLPNIFPGPVVLYYAGSADHATNGRGAGDSFLITSTQAEDATFEFNFNDWVYLAGGYMQWSGAVAGDWVSMKLKAPATPVTAAAQNDGNCNVVNGVIVPAAGNGAYNVDLTQAVPVPAQAAATGDDEGSTNGYWDWTEPQTGKGTVTASGAPGAAKWHLIAADVDLTRFVSKLQLLGSSQLDVTLSAIKPKKILPHWKLHVTLHNSTAKTLSFVWLLVTARVKSV